MVRRRRVEIDRVASGMICLVGQVNDPRDRSTEVHIHVMFCHVSFEREKNSIAYHVLMSTM